MSDKSKKPYTQKHRGGEITFYPKGTYKPAKGDRIVKTRPGVIKFTDTKETKYKK